jgi:hypothetical protein
VPAGCGTAGKGRDGSRLASTAIRSAAGDMYPTVCWRLDNSLKIRRMRWCYEAIYPGISRRKRMISSLTEFDEATAFERWALEALVPLPASRPHQGVMDVALNHVWVTMVETAIGRGYAGGVREVNVDLRPLAFGAAWKILDLMLEMAFWHAGIRARRLRIDTKKERAAQAFGLLPPLTADRDLWHTMTSVYVATTEIRHSLIHRFAEVDRVTGTLTGRDASGHALAPITADQQEAFCRAVQRTAIAALAGRISPRERSDVVWQLDQLQHHHQQPILGGVRLQAAGLLIASVAISGRHLVIDVPSLRQAGRSTWVGRGQIDATFSLPDGRHLLVELEQAPSAIVNIDPDDPPDWAEQWEGPPDLS